MEFIYGCFSKSPSSSKLQPEDDGSPPPPPRTGESLFTITFNTNSSNMTESDLEVRARL